jgi:uncharacterized protein involved in outer membrane biogenesis
MNPTIGSGHRMGKRLAKRIILILLAVLVISGMLAGMLLFAPLGLSVRQTIAETILSKKLGRPVTVLGNASVDFQKTIRIAVSDAYFIAEGVGEPDAKQRAFRRISFQAPYSLLLGQTSGVSNFEISGIVFEFNSRTHEATDENPLSSTLLTHLLSNPLFENIRFSDAAFRYSDPENGWNEELKVAKLLVETPQQSNTSTLDVHAHLNNAPITFAGKIQKASAKENVSSATVQIEASSSSFTAAFAGVVDYSEPQARLDGDFTAVSGSLADLLQVLSIESGLEARASYASRLIGPVDALRHNHLEFRLETAAGTALSVTGTLDQEDTEQPVDVSFAIDLSRQSDKAADGNLAVTVLGLSGNVRGTFEQVELLDGRIATSAAVLDLQEIGPISARRVIKNPDGTVRLTGLSVQGGRRDAPTLSLSGEIGDLFDLRQVDLDGRYDFPTEALLNLADTAASQLGTLSGNIRLNDQDGVFGLKDLTGKVSGTDLFDLSYELEVPELRYIDEFSYRLAFAVPEFSRFLAALGGPQRDTLQPFSFDGRVTLSDNLMALKGDMLSGASNIVAALSLTEPEAPGALVLTGDISSEELDFSDFRNLFDLAQTKVSFKTPDIEHVETHASSFTADLDLTIGELVSNGKRAGNVQGKLAHADKAVALAPFSLAYLGGTLNGDFSADFAKDPVALKANGRVDKFRFGQLLREIGIATDFNSTAFLSFDVAGAGPSARQFSRTLTGRLTGSLWGGILPNRVLDLSGLNLVTWLSTGGGGKPSKLVCAVLPFHFKNGVASTKSLILETEDVQVVGSGSVSLQNQTLDLAFVPRSKRKQLVEIVSAFELDGPIGAPKLTVRDAGAGRAVGEILSMPLSVVGRIFHGSGLIDETAKPCVLPKNTGPK